MSEEHPISSLIKRYVLWIFVPVIPAFALLALFFAVSEDRSRPSPDEEIRQAAEDIRSRVTSIKLETSHVIFKDMPQPRMQFKLTINPFKGESKDAVYLFNKYEYTLTTGGADGKVPTAQICELIDSIYDRKDPILEALRELKAGGKVSFPIWKGFSAELELGNVTPILVEMLYAQRRFIELKTTHPEIMIRGYADGQKRFWERPLEEYYRYESFPVYPALDPHSKTQNIFIKEERPTSIRDLKYRNEHLPDLRAHFVRKDLVEPYFALCRNTKPEAYVLKGFEYKELWDEPLERKVEVFILIYDN